MSLNPPEPGSDLSELYGDDTAHRPRLSLVGFIVPVALVATAGAAGLFYYDQQVTREQTIATHKKAAREATKRFDLKSLRAGQAHAEAILALDPQHPDGLAYAGLAQVGMARHGLDGTNKAEAHYRIATQTGVDTPVIHAVGGYVDILSGRADKAERDLTARLQSGGGAPIMGHALGWAKAERGAYLDARQMMRQAVDRDFSAVGYRLTLAEYAHRQGALRRAVSQLQAAYGKRGNPDLALAKAWGAALMPRVLGAYADVAKLIADVEAKGSEIGPKTAGYLAWAKAEHALSTGDSKKAAVHAQEATARLPNFAPIEDLEARIALRRGDRKAAVRRYERAVEMKPLYRGTQWALAELKSEMGSPDALPLVAELERSASRPSPKYELFRAEHFLRQGRLKKARSRFEAAAQLGDDPQILYGLARLTYAEEQKKGARADITKVAKQLEQVLARRRRFPEVYAYVGDLQLAQERPRPAHDNYLLAEKDYWTENRPIPEVVAFYDRVVDRFGAAKGRRAKRFAQVWSKRKRNYLTSIRKVAPAPETP